ncbi:MAG TPA: RDD family protein [Streptosporangiaceae bacterium]|nr:RDD family protein [Streptosporangiaceae bacterium]
MARRVGALFVDWLLCWAIVVVAIRPYQADIPYWTLLVFAAQDYAFTALTGFTMGKLLLRIRVIRLNGGLVGPGWALVRTLLLLTVVPPLMVDRDLRGLHDRAANSVVIRV